MFISVTYKMHLQIDKENIKNFKKNGKISQAHHLQKRKIKVQEIYH